MKRNNNKYQIGKRLKKNITIAFLGIDGTGKSTHAEKINAWLNEKEIKSIVIPFHKWLFAGILKKKFGSHIDQGRENASLEPYTPKRHTIAALVKPLVSLIDNTMMYYLSKWKYRNYDIIIFDRFICATFIKGLALNYHVEWLRPLWQNITTDIVLVLDAPVNTSLNLIEDRGDHIMYTTEQLLLEKNEYFKIAKKFRYPVFDTSKSLDDVHEEIKNHLSGIIFFPPLKGEP